MLPDPPERRTRLAALVLAAAGGAVVAARLLRADRLELVSLLLGLIAGLSILLVGRAWVRRVGPRHLLDVALPFGALLLVVLWVHDPLGLPGTLTLLVHPLAGASAGLIGLGIARLPRGLSTRWARPLFAVVAGSLLGIALAWILLRAVGLGPGWVYLLLAGGVLFAWWLLAGVPDPVHPGASPLGPYVPWGEVPARRPWPASRRVPLRAPATLGYLVLSWALFLWLGEPEPGGWGLDTTRYEAWLYHIPDLGQAPLEALGSLVTATFLNHDHVQLVYVTVLLGLFGLPFEVREGTGRAAAVFAVTGLVGALVAGVLLHGLVVVFPDVGLFEEAWARTWSGGSVGAFGLMGALAARARRPWPLLGFFVFWELNVGAWFLRSYTPAFHLTALVTGYLLARHWMGPGPGD